MSSDNVLKKLLRPKSQAEVLESFLAPEKAFKTGKTRKPGRPKVAKEKKAKNFTVCLAPQFLDFIDKMVVKDPKVQGRGRKIRFIIERFIEHEKRSLHHMRIFKDSLIQVQKVLQGFGGRVRKNAKLELSNKEKESITKAVDQVHLMMKILGYSPKVLHRMISKEEWAILSFCLDWKSNRGVVV